MFRNMSNLLFGGRHVDARGVLRFCNDFDMSTVKRFYTIANSTDQPVRGWIGHRKETKWFFPVKGVTMIEIEPMDDGRVERVDRVEGSVGDVSRVERVERVDEETYTLSADAPAVLKVPPGNWFCIKQDGNAEVMVFSDCKVGEFENDDFRRPL